MASRKGVSAAFHLSVHPSAGLCIVSTYVTFAIKEQIPLGICSFLSVIQYQAIHKQQMSDIPCYFVRIKIFPAFFL